MLNKRQKFEVLKKANNSQKDKNGNVLVQFKMHIYTLCHKYQKNLMKFSVGVAM